jgi:hypothetical protein
VFPQSRHLADLLGGRGRARQSSGRRSHEKEQPEELVAALDEDVLPHAQRDEWLIAAVGLKTEGGGEALGPRHGRRRANGRPAGAYESRAASE